MSIKISLKEKLENLKENVKSQEGFTLIELLVVVLIVGILAAIVIPIFVNQTDKAKDSEALSNLRQAATAAQTFYTDNDSYTGFDSDALSELTNGLTAPAAFDGDSTAGDNDNSKKVWISGVADRSINLCTASTGQSIYCLEIDRDPGAGEVSERKGTADSGTLSALLTAMANGDAGSWN